MAEADRPVVCRITVKDMELGTEQVVELRDDDYFLLTTGNCHRASVQAYPAKGTHVLTIKGVGRAHE